MEMGRKTVLFREVNDCIDTLLCRFSSLEDEADFFCECPSAHCARRLPLTRREYEQVRAVGGFLLAPDCADEYSVVEWTGRYAVVDKFHRRPQLRLVGAGSG
jgi:hypothetical protein